MLAFSLQALDLYSNGLIFIFLVAMGLVILGWVTKVVPSWFYTPYTESFRGTAAVVIPVADESIDIFHEVVNCVLLNKPSQLVIVHNGPANRQLESLTLALAQTTSTTVSYHQLDAASKRQAIIAGVSQLTEDVVVLVDSDTFWGPETLNELLRPFADERVGGVTGKQRIQRTTGSIWERWADWFELVRSEYQLPAMSVFGQVGCLPGRTIAFRRKVLVEHADEFLSDKFLGIHHEVSDDRSLTNYALKMGLRTVYQSTSAVTTLAPSSFRLFARQQLRWAKGSQYNTIRMFPWMLRHSRFLLWLYTLDLVIPVLLFSNVIVWISSPFTRASWTETVLGEAVLVALANGLFGMGVLISAAIVASWAFMAIRTSRVISIGFSNLIFLPIFMLLNFFVLVPIRVLGLATCGWLTSWGTRHRGQRHRNRRRRRVVDARQLIPTVSVVLSVALLVRLGI